MKKASSTSALKSFLFEIGVEEIPARFIPQFLDEMAVSTTRYLDTQRLSYSQVQTYGTYRRLAVIVSGLPDMQPDQALEIKGPPLSIAVDAKGNWTNAAHGFAKKNHISVDDLIQKTQDGQSYCIAKMTVKGQPAPALLPGLCEAIVNGFSFPIAMKWGQGVGPFFRPVHWVVALWDTQPIPVSLFGMQSGDTSFGHRFLTQNQHDSQSIHHYVSQTTIASGYEFRVTSANLYKKELAKHHVIVDQNKRRQAIMTALQKAEPTVVMDEALLTEVTFLVESPTILTGTFDSAFLEIPKEVLVECMRKHQKYFVAETEKETGTSGKSLAPRFCVVADNVTPKSKANIIAGNERVLTARLNDVSFFWREDRKKSLESFNQRLKTVVFQKGLGSLFDKVMRIRALSACVAEQLNLPKAKRNTIDRTATLCKADLATLMVYELPELQGVMGDYYARESGETPAVATGISTHYQPKFSTDMPPQSVEGAIVGIADKLDTAVACFVNNLIPTGSQDPYAVRRALMGILSICEHHSWDIDMAALVTKAYSLLEKGEPNRDAFNVFYHQRLRTFIIEKGVEYDCADAVLAVQSGTPSLIDSLACARALNNEKTLNTRQLKACAEMAVRIKRLAQQHATSSQFDVKKVQSEPESEAATAYQKLTAKIVGKPKDVLLPLFYELVPVMDRYFDAVMVMASDPVLKENRVSFMYELDRCFRSFCEFEQLVIPSQ